MSTSTRRSSTSFSRAPAARAGLVLPLLATALALVAVAAIGVGAYPIAPELLWRGLLGGEFPDQAATVLFQVRLPRVAAALLTGAALAAAAIGLIGWAATTGAPLSARPLELRLATNLPGPPTPGTSRGPDPIRFSEAVERAIAERGLYRTEVTA